VVLLGVTVLYIVYYVKNFYFIKIQINKL